MAKNTSIAIIAKKAFGPGVGGIVITGFSAHDEAIATFFFAGLFCAIPTIFYGASGRTAIIRVGVAIITDFAMVGVFGAIATSAAVGSTIIKTIGIPVASFILSGINDVVATPGSQSAIGITTFVGAGVIGSAKIARFTAMGLPIATISAHIPIYGILGPVKIIATSRAVLAVGIAKGVTSFCTGDCAIATIITKVGRAV